MSQEYEVEEIVGTKVEDGKTFYRVKWIDYPPEQNTWEPMESVKHTSALVDFREMYDSLDTDTDDEINLVTPQQWMMQSPKPKKKPKRKLELSPNRSSRSPKKTPPPRPPLRRPRRMLSTPVKSTSSLSKRYATSDSEDDRPKQSQKRHKAAHKSSKKQKPSKEDKIAKGRKKSKGLKQSKLVFERFQSKQNKSEPSQDDASSSANTKSDKNHKLATSISKKSSKHKASKASSPLVIDLLDSDSDVSPSPGSQAPRPPSSTSPSVTPTVPQVDVPPPPPLMPSLDPVKPDLSSIQPPPTECAKDTAAIDLTLDSDKENGEKVNDSDSTTEPEDGQIDDEIVIQGQIVPPAKEVSAHSPPLRALTIKQPFAEAIIFGPKRVENRNCFKIRGSGEWIAIHVSRSESFLSETFLKKVRLLWPNIPSIEHMRKRKGQLLGLAHFTQRCKPHDVTDEIDKQWASFPKRSRFCFVIDRVHPLPEPRISITGFVGFFKIPAEEREVVEKLKLRICQLN